MTDDTGAKPKRVYTEEEKAKILRSMRRANLFVFVIILIIAALGIGLVYVQTEDITITAITAVGVVAYLVYREIKLRRGTGK